MRWLWTIPLLCSMAFGQATDAGLRLEQLGRTWFQQQGSLTIQRAVSRPTDATLRTAFDLETIRLRAALNARFSAEVRNAAKAAEQASVDSRGTAMLQTLEEAPSSSGAIVAGKYLIKSARQAAGP